MGGRTLALAAYSRETPARPGDAAGELPACSSSKHLDNNSGDIIELRRVLRKLAHGAIECIQNFARGLFMVLANNVERSFDPEKRFIRRHRLFYPIREQQ